MHIKYEDFSPGCSTVRKGIFCPEPAAALGKGSRRLDLLAPSFPGQPECVRRWGSWGSWGLGPGFHIHLLEPRR